MIKLKTMPKATAAELLLFLAQHESFANTCQQLENEMSSAEVKAMFRELAAELNREAASEGEQDYKLSSDRSVAKKTKDVLSYLSPREERRILSAFGLIDKD